MITIALDVMGFENNISEAIRASREFIKKNPKVKIILVGNKDFIKPHLKNESEFEILHTDIEIKQDDTILSLRSKKDSSMQKAIELVKDNKADGVLSAGNSAIYVFLTYQIFGLMDEVKKIGFIPFVPTFKGNGFNIVDVGASIDCDENDIYNFAIMGSITAQSRGIQKPRIGLLNIGVEKHKGFDWHKKVDQKLRDNSSINYVGYVESKNLLQGICDVVVADGYTGNVLLKTLEGTSKSIMYYLLSKYKKWYNLFGLLFSLPVLLAFKKKFDYKNNAGAFVLGVNKIAVKTHGSADQKQFYSSLRMLKESIEFDLLNKLKKEFNNGEKNRKL